MSYTTQEYAEAAHQTNEQGKILVVIDGELMLQDPSPPTPEEVAEAEAAEARAEATVILDRVMQRNFVQFEDFTPRQYATFAKAGLYDEWTPGEDYFAGLRIAREGIVYQVKQQHTSMAHQPPGSAGMLAIYQPISVEGEAEADGSLEAPFTLLVGMEGIAGKYYLWAGQVYKCLRQMSNILENWVPGSPGMDSYWELAG